MDKNRHLWEDCARYVLTRFMLSKQYEPVDKIILVRSWRDIPKWDHLFIKHRERMNIKDSTFDFFTYEVPDEA
jgi:hypothetical protein